MAPFRTTPKKTSEESFLLKLPNETIASCLPTDLDMLNLALSCNNLYKRILDRKSTIWRSYFGDKYEIPDGRDSGDLMVEYQIRTIVLAQKIDFTEDSHQQRLWLDVIQTMLIESLTLPPRSGRASKTFKQIREAVERVDFLSQPQRRHSSDIFCAIQLCLTALVLDKLATGCCLRFEYDIAAVYSYDADISGPFIDHDALDLSSLLHMRNFWQRHILDAHEGTFYFSFAQLRRDLKPILNSHPEIEDLRGFQTTWMGYYSCIHPLPRTSEQLQNRQTCADLDSHWDQVEIMTLTFQTKADEFWPEDCNNMIPRYEGPGMKRYFNGIQSVHKSNNNVENPLFGFMEPIAVPYGGFPGWKRICFAICEQPKADQLGILAAGPSPWAHGYEAVIVPGGRAMIGRWVDLRDPSGRGPFIFWAV
ncbi:hypothetical protein N7492_002885 [Penicillium capsulatum]|uniref:Uncharacterized protein n=1 Tax=Penicillium capsulatum TaxID=69766 RepID=A0A9W9IJI1_9EURO|nr:hypothetical protein N7492_002885 [Penicillium capsulatum]